MRLALSLALALLAPTLAAQPAADWHLQDPASGVPGIALEAAYDLLDGMAPREVVVAIIDSGVDAEHPDLAPVMWVNADEVAGNGVDDDANGYVDDVHGWSFLGGADGRNVGPERLEIARLVAACRAAATPEPACADYEAAFEAEVAELRQAAANLFPVHAQMKGADSLLAARFPDTYDPAGDVAALNVGGDVEAEGAKRMLSFLSPCRAPPSPSSTGTSPTSGSAWSTTSTRTSTPAPSSATTSRTSPSATTATPTPKAPDASHGTGVAGLVAAARGKRPRHRRHRAEHGCGRAGADHGRPRRARRRRVRQGHRQRDLLRGGQRRAHHQHELRQGLQPGQERRGRGRAVRRRQRRPPRARRRERREGPHAGPQLPDGPHAGRRPRLDVDRGRRELGRRRGPRGGVLQLRAGRRGPLRAGRRGDVPRARRARRRSPTGPALPRRSWRAWPPS